MLRNTRPSCCHIWFARARHGFAQLLGLDKDYSHQVRLLKTFSNFHTFFEFHLSLAKLNPHFEKNYVSKHEMCIFMHKNICKIRYNFLFENYSFQYKMYKIIGITVLLITIWHLYDLSIWQCWFSTWFVIKKFACCIKF